MRNEKFATEELGSPNSSSSEIISTEIENILEEFLKNIKDEEFVEIAADDTLEEILNNVDSHLEAIPGASASYDEKLSISSVAGPSSNPMEEELTGDFNSAAGPSNHIDYEGSGSLLRAALEADSTATALTSKEKGRGAEIDIYFPYLEAAGSGSDLEASGSDLEASGSESSLIEKMNEDDFIERMDIDEEYYFPSLLKNPDFKTILKEALTDRRLKNLHVIDREDLIRKMKPNIRTDAKRVKALKARWLIKIRQRCEQEIANLSEAERMSPEKIQEKISGLLVKIYSEIKTGKKVFTNEIRKEYIKIFGNRLRVKVGNFPAGSLERTYRLRHILREKGIKGENLLVIGFDNGKNNHVMLLHSPDKNLLDRIKNVNVSEESNKQTISAYDRFINVVADAYEKHKRGEGSELFFVNPFSQKNKVAGFEDIEQDQNFNAVLSKAIEAPDRGISVIQNLLSKEQQGGTSILRDLLSQDQEGAALLRDLLPEQAYHCSSSDVFKAWIDGVLEESGVTASSMEKNKARIEGIKPLWRQYEAQSDVRFWVHPSKDRHSILTQPPGLSSSLLLLDKKVKKRNFSKKKVSRIDDSLSLALHRSEASKKKRVNESLSSTPMNERVGKDKETEAKKLKKNAIKIPVGGMP